MYDDALPVLLADLRSVEGHLSPGGPSTRPLLPANGGLHCTSPHREEGIAALVPAI